LAHPAHLSEHDHAAETLEEGGTFDHLVRVEMIDPTAEHDPDEPVDVTASVVHRERLLTQSLEVVAKHEVVLAFVATMLLDVRDEHALARKSRLNRGKDAVDAGVTTVLVVDINRCQQIQVSAAQTREHDGPSLTA